MNKRILKKKNKPNLRETQIKAQIKVAYPPLFKQYCKAICAIHRSMRHDRMIGLYSRSRRDAFEEFYYIGFGRANVKAGRFIIDLSGMIGHPFSPDVLIGAPRMYQSISHQRIKSGRTGIVYSHGTFDPNTGNFTDS